MSDGQDQFAIVVVTIVAWAATLTAWFGTNVNWLVTLWIYVGGTIWLGVMIFGTIGVWAICMDLYTEWKWRHPADRWHRKR